MKIWKFTNQFSLLIVCLFTFITISCKEENSSPTAPQNKILNAETVEKLQAVADKVMMEKGMPGLIAYIAVEGEGELYISRGVGNLATSEPMNINNYFRVASVTKTFTTETVLILADEGKIDLGKTIGFYLPEYSLPGKDTITIRMLGNMTSGLIEFMSDPVLIAAYYNSQGTAKFTPEELIAPVLNSQLMFTPGTHYFYCNTNTVLLGMVIKKVTGKEVKDVFAEKIFRPLGLTHTFWPETNFLPSPYHHAYTNLLGPPNADVTYYGNSWGNSAGILISNLADLKIWAKELSEMKLLSASAKLERFKIGSPEAHYGFGLELYGNLVGHAGAIVGYNSMVYSDGVRKITIITHVNTFEDNPAGFAFVEFAKILGYDLSGY
ncbi:MAG: serine hydrolase domain-containing protein [Ignavibacteriaceae bacterium]|jgi:D-alanyl-D-alanine carboxypeptidase